jgi:hypothetical protein
LNFLKETGVEVSANARITINSEAFIQQIFKRYVLKAITTNNSYFCGNNKATSFEN